MTNFINSLFAPVTNLLDLMIVKLNDLSTVLAHGVRLNDYFSVFSVLGSAWTSVITSLIASIIFLFVLYSIQKISGVLLWFKNLIKWW